MHFSHLYCSVKPVVPVTLLKRQEHVTEKRLRESEMKAKEKRSKRQPQCGCEFVGQLCHPYYD